MRNVQNYILNNPYNRFNSIQNPYMPSLGNAPFFDFNTTN